jgi:hypothetical protein
MDSDERELFAALARGDRAAAEELVERTYRQVWALCCRLCGDPEQAADLAQETYRKAWAGLAGFAGRSRRPGCTGSPPTRSSTGRAAPAGAARRRLRRDAA